MDMDMGMGACARWNESARSLVARHRISITAASRIYALLSVAQYDACVLAYQHQERPTLHPARKTSLPVRTTQVAHGSSGNHRRIQAAVGAASAAVLGHLLPDELESLQRKAAASERAAPGNHPAGSSTTAGAARLGRVVGELVVRRATREGPGADYFKAAPGRASASSEGRWMPPANRPPLDPHWGQVRPWLMRCGSQFRVDPPPAFGSVEFQDALAEVGFLSRTRTPEQARIAALWADGPGSYTPSGRWNKIAADLIVAARLSEPEAARAFALLNMALMDAGIGCWESKFHYRLIRPSQVDPSITTPVGLPEFPSYPSAHAAFSGAAAGVLSHLFPERAQFLQAKAEEAATSRVYGGIHFRFDSQAGLRLGARVAKLALAGLQPNGSL